MNSDKHTTTVTSYQRKQLIRILSAPIMGYDIMELAEKTDVELHELWLVECEYPNPYKD